MATQHLPTERASTHQTGNRGAQDAFHFHGCPNWSRSRPWNGSRPWRGKEGAHLSCAGRGGAAGTRAARQRKACIWSAAGTGARPEGGEGADWDKGPKQEGESKTGREGSQGSRGSAQNKAEKGKKVTARKGKTGRGRIRQGVWSPTMSLEGRRNHR